MGSQCTKKIYISPAPYLMKLPKHLFIKTKNQRILFCNADSSEVPRESHQMKMKKLHLRINMMFNRQQRALTQKIQTIQLENRIQKILPLIHRQAKGLDLHTMEYNLLFKAIKIIKKVFHAEKKLLIWRLCKFKKFQVLEAIKFI